jgi:3D (Asp-Asp-Asp) domain-containing protein/peptidoglycan hydrolase CwlO-like protein
MLFGGLPATGPAQSPGTGSLRARGAELERRSRAAALDLYALGTRLDQTRAELARIDAQLAALREEQAAARQEYRAALVTETRAQQQLGAQLRLLYEEDEPDPIAVILGSATLNDVIEGLDTIKRIAHATESVLDQAKHARTRVATQRRHLAAKVANTAKARASAAQSAQNLLAAEAERRAYITQLRTEQQLNAQQIAAVEQRAAEAQQRAQLVTAQAAAAPPATATTPATPSARDTAEAAQSPQEATTTFESATTAAPGEPPPPAVESVSQSSSSSTSSAPGPPRAGGSLSVDATGYCLKGTTATGLPVGPGIVAVDPTVIPLGTRMSIPGYGDGVAADTGGAITGNRIDLWFASCSEASAFTRTVTITFL